MASFSCFLVKIVHEVSRDTGIVVEILFIVRGSASVAAVWADFLARIWGLRPHREPEVYRLITGCPYCID
jgi:hypothetical protein